MEPDPVATAVAAVRAGGVVLAPTDTVYGLCATPHDAAVALRVTRLKGRGEGTPLALLAADLDTLLELVPELRGHAVEAAARALLPGAFTLVLPNPARRLPWLSGGRPDTIGARVPALGGVARDLLDSVGAVLATSANLHGGRDPARVDDVPTELRTACAAVLDGGPLPGVPSTVVDLSGEEARILREGAVPASEALARVAAALP